MISSYFYSYLAFDSYFVLVANGYLFVIIKESAIFLSVDLLEYYVIRHDISERAKGMRNKNAFLTTDKNEEF